MKGYKAKNKASGVGLHYSARVIGLVPEGGLKPGEVPVEIRRGRKKGTQRRRRRRNVENQ